MQFSTLLSLLEVVALTGFGRRLYEHTTNARFGLLKNLDCNSANSDACEAACVSNENWLQPNLSRALYRDFLLTLGSECNIYADIERFTDRTGFYAASLEDNSLKILADIIDVFERQNPIVQTSEYDHFVRLYVDDATPFDGRSIQIFGENKDNLVSETLKSLNDTILEVNTTSVWTPDNYGATLLFGTTAPRFDLSYYTVNQSRRVEFWYRPKVKFRIQGIDTLGHLSLDED